MRVVALVLGILGAVFGFCGALLAEGVGGLGSAFGVANAHLLMGLGLLAFAAAIVGLIGAILAMSAPRAAWILMLIAAVPPLVTRWPGRGSSWPWWRPTTGWRTR